MTRTYPDGSTYVDSKWGYVMEKRGGLWKRQHRLVMEDHLGRKLLQKEVVHHIDGNRQNNTLGNLQTMSDAEHRSLHSKQRRWSDEVKKKMSESAKRVAADPEERKRRSKRAKEQWRYGNFGRKTK